MSGTPHEGGPESGIYKSINAGETWTKLTNGLPSGPLGRIGLDVAFSDPNIIYAFVDNRNVPAPPDAIPGGSESNQAPRESIGGEIYRSNDKGSTWFKAFPPTTKTKFSPWVTVATTRLMAARPSSKLGKSSFVSTIHVD